MKPMLAAKDVKDLRFPCFASAKIDGIRAIVQDGILLSRTLKPIPNGYTQTLFGSEDLHGLDGELAVGPPNAPDLMQRTTSGVMSHEGEPDVSYWIFDYWTDVHTRFDDRLLRLQAAVNGNYIDEGSPRPRVRLLPQYVVHNADELLKLESDLLAEGFEGVMTRCPEGRYKYGRSTSREQFLVKHKRFTDGEAVVIGFEERMHNANEATLDERGYMKRSSHQDNLIPMNTLGALIVKDLETGIQFNIGTGFVDAERKYIWNNKQSYLNSIAVYKHFEQVGVKDAPRFPVFKGFRHRDDTLISRTHND